ncbi:MAG: hypothetical protein H0X33_00240 [Taibaiella sp.]|nr:hypothetical protein [Taibaiella sp.]
MRKLMMFLMAGILPLLVHGQELKEEIGAKPHKKIKETFYFSWGYNGEWYTNSDIKVDQPSLNNNYTFVNVNGHDHKGWSDGIFNKAVTIPQYNYRLGYFFNDEKGYGIEINFDHTKFIVSEPQAAHVKGMLHGEKVDTTVNFQESNGFYYYLNNGANFFLINFVKRWHLFATENQNIKIDALGKIGVGPVVPHVQNMLFGKENASGFQYGGWNTGIEGTIKVILYNWGFIEYSNKLDYARYSNLAVYQGTAKQAFGTYEMVLSLGITIPKKVKG